MAKGEDDDLARLAKLLAGAKLFPVLDRRCPLGEVPEVLRFAETDRARGKVVITVA